MFLVFSNTGNWDEDSLGFVGIVRNEAIINCGAKGAIQAYLEYHETKATQTFLNLDESVPISFLVNECDSKYQDLMDENELSLYAEGDPAFYATIPIGETYVDVVYVFIPID